METYSASSVSGPLPTNSGKQAPASESFTQPSCRQLRDPPSLLSSPAVHPVRLSDESEVHLVLCQLGVQRGVGAKLAGTFLMSEEDQENSNRSRRPRRQTGQTCNGRRCQTRQDGTNPFGSAPQVLRWTEQDPRYTSYWKSDRPERASVFQSVPRGALGTQSSCLAPRGHRPRLFSE